MADVDYYDDSETPTKLIEVLGEAAMDIIAWIFLVAELIAVLFGIISWIVLKNFRTFRNYVLISALIANVLLALVMRICNYFISGQTVDNHPALRVIPLAFFVFFQMVYLLWLLVLCYVLSVDFEKVFNYDSRLKYVLSTLFAWGVPFTTVLLYVIVGSVLINWPGHAKNIFIGVTGMLLFFIPVALSFITYIAVVCRLFCGASTNNKCKGLTIATLIFSPSNVFIGIALASLFQNNGLAVDVIGTLSEYLLIITLIVFMVILKSNWKLWTDFFNKRPVPESGVMLGDQRI